MYYMEKIPTFALTLESVVNQRYAMIRQYLKKDMRVKDLLIKYGITGPDFYKFLKRFKKYGEVGLQNLKRGRRIPVNKTSPDQEVKVISFHRKYPFFSSYEMDEILSLKPRTIQRILKRYNLKKIYKPKPEKKRILERLKKEYQRKRRTENFQNRP